MHKIQIATAALSLVGGTLAAVAACVPNAFELQNLQHHHDINTGDVVGSDEVVRSRLKVAGGSGCSPLWAGGSFDDSALFNGGQHPEFLSNIIMPHGPSKGGDQKPVRRRRSLRRTQMPDLSRRHGPGSPKNPTPPTVQRRHGPGSGSPKKPMPPSLERRHGPSTPKTPKLVRRLGPGSSSPKTPAPGMLERNLRLPRRHSPSEPRRPKTVRTKRHGPDENDGHFVFDDKKAQVVERRHGPDEDDGHFVFDEKVKSVERRHGPDENDGHLVYDEKVKAI